MAAGFAVCFGRTHPRAVRLVSPRAHNSMLALARLRRGEPLIPGTSGFGLIYESLCDLFRQQQREVPDINDIRRLEYRGSKSGVPDVVFIVRKSFESQIEFDPIERLVEHRYHHILAWPALAAFVFGLLLAAVSRVL